MLLVVQAGIKKNLTFNWPSKYKIRLEIAHYIVERISFEA